MNYRLHTERLGLREIEESDLDFVAALRGNPEIMRYYSKCITQDEAWELIRNVRKRYIERGHNLWLAVDRITEANLGIVGLTMQPLNATELVPEVSYMLAKPYWGRGLATEGTLAVRDFAFREEEYPFVTAFIHPENAASERIAKKLEMVEWTRSMTYGREHIVYRALNPVVNSELHA